MPININDPEYVKAEKAFHEATNPEDQLAALNNMISHAPAHKGAENLRQQLTTRRKKIESQIEKNKKVGKVTKVGIKKEDMQAIFIGKKTVGKSSLMNLLTNSHLKTSEKEYNTKKPEVAMMNYATTQVQLIENPALGSEYYDRGIPHTADTILLVVTNLEDVEELLKEKDIIIKEKDTIICKNNEKLTNELINRPQQVVNNSNTNYTLQFNKLKDNLIPFTDDNIKNCIKNIKSPLV